MRGILFILWWTLKRTHHLFLPKIYHKKVHKTTRIKLVQLCILPVWMWIPTHIRSWLCKVDVHMCIHSSFPHHQHVSFFQTHSYSRSQFLLTIYTHSLITSSSNESVSHIHVFLHTASQSSQANLIQSPKYTVCLFFLPCFLSYLHLLKSG